MWILIALTLAGLVLKFAAIYRCFRGYRQYRQYWHMPEIGFCLIFSLLVFIQIGLELYGYRMYFTRIPSTVLSLLKIYYVVILAILFCIPIAIDVIVLHTARIAKTAGFLILWAALSIAIFSTEWFVASVTIMPPTFTRVPGPLYDWISITCMISLIYCLAQLFLIKHKSDNILARVKASNLIIGFCLLAIATIAVVLPMKLGIQITGSGILSFSLGLLVFILAGQFNDARIFDLRVLIPGTGKWKAFWRYSRHLHTVSADPKHCQGLIDGYTENLLEIASRICANQKQMAEYLGFSQATISRRMKQLIQNESTDMQSDSK